MCVFTRLGKLGRPITCYQASQNASAKVHCLEAESAYKYSFLKLKVMTFCTRGSFMYSWLTLIEGIIIIFVVYASSSSGFGGNWCGCD